MTIINSLKNISLKQFYVWLLMSLMILFIIKNPILAISATIDGITLCGNAIIPSLFPFLVLSNLVIDSGFSDFLGYIFKKPVQFLFGLSENCVCAFLLGIISGFPIGAKCAVSLYEKKLCSKNEAERLIAFCNNTGPAFLIGGVGIALWNDYSIGVILYVSQVVSAIFIGIGLNIFRNKHTPCKNTNRSQNISPKFNMSILSKAVTNASLSMLSICGFVLFFSVFLKMLSIFVIFLSHSFAFNTNVFISLIYGFFEISSGVSVTATLFGNTDTYFWGVLLTAFIVGWSGLSVHFQVVSFTFSQNLSLKKYYISKFIQGLLTVLFTMVLFKFL